MAGEATLTTDDEDNKRHADEISDLRQQMSTMQLHLQQSEQKRQAFEERVLVELTRLQEQATMPAEARGGQTTTQQQLLANPKSSSIMCGDMHAFNFHTTEAD